MPFFTKSFTESLAPKETEGASRDGYANPSQIGKTLPNPFRFAILSEEPLEGFEVWFDKPDGSKTKRVAAGGYPSADVLAEYERTIGAKVAFEVDYETKQPTDRLAIKQCAAFFIWDYSAEAIKVLSYTQKSLLGEIGRKTADPDYEDLTAWDLEITKVTSPKVAYSADMKPALRAKDGTLAARINAAWAEAKAAGADIWRLTAGGNPFSSK